MSSLSTVRSLAQEKKDLTKALYLHLCQDPPGKELTKDELSLAIARLDLTDQFDYDSNGAIKGKKASLCDSLRSTLEDVIAVKPASYGMVPIDGATPSAPQVTNPPLLNLAKTKASIIDDILINPGRRLAERATAAENAFLDQLKTML